MKLEILEYSESEYSMFACENPICNSKEGRSTKKILRITFDYIKHLHICFNCLKKGVNIKLEFEV